MSDRELEAALRRLETDPEDPSRLTRARQLVLRGAPGDAALRARLCAAAVGQAPRGQERREEAFGAIDGAMGGTLALAPGGRSLLWSRNTWSYTEYGSGHLLCEVRTFTADGLELGEAIVCRQPDKLDPYPHTFSADGSAVFFARPEEMGREVRVRDLESGDDILLGEEEGMRHAECSALVRRREGLRLALAGDEALQTLDIDGGVQASGSWPLVAEEMAFDQVGERLAVARHEGGLACLAMDGRSLVSEAGPSSVEQLLWGGDGRLYVMGDDALWIFDAVDEEPLSFEAWGQRLILDLRARVAILTGSRLQFWDLQQLCLIAEVPCPEGLADLALDEDKGRLTAVFEDGALAFWDW